VFLFPNPAGTAFSVGNYLKKRIKPLAEKVGIHDLTHQAFRLTSSTHMQSHAGIKICSVTSGIRIPKLR
jgi:hypothetical protein